MAVEEAWPSNWADRLAGDGCTMCGKGRPDEDEYGVRIYAGVRSDAYLQRVNLQPGYTLVIWRGRHVAEPTDLGDDEAAEYWLEVLRVARALQEHYRPMKMNYETLGNIEPHLHTHLVPRYEADPAPGKPFPLLREPAGRIAEADLWRDATALRALVSR